MASSSLLEACFLCTFCWHPQYPPARPKVLGREARIACEACWRSVLNLSICWVCGEMVARGEEVVSLGWCFWHRGCFGCLLCGTHLDPPKIGGDELVLGDCDEEDLARGAKNGKSSRGVELENVPLCTWCENATESMQDREVLENGLVNVTRKDGGLSRSRLAFLTGLSETNHEDLPKEIDSAQSSAGNKDVTATSPICFGPSHPADAIIDQFEKASAQERPANHLKAASEMGTGEDGSLDLASRCNSPAPFMKSAETPVLYLSVLSVLSEPAFRPSKTKPIPKWMTLLPRNRQEDKKTPQPIPAPRAKHWTTEPADNKAQESRRSLGTIDFRLHHPCGSVDESIARLNSNHNSSTHTEAGRANHQSTIPHRNTIDPSSVCTSRQASPPPYKRIDSPYPFAEAFQHRPIFNRPHPFPRFSHTKIVPTLATHREQIIYPPVSTLASTLFSETTGPSSS